MKKKLTCFAVLVLGVILSAMSIGAQNSAPPPGAPGAPGMNSAPPPGRPAPPPGPAWGSPWNSGWAGGMYSPGWNNNGYMTVTACGYDAQGVWRVLPLYVQYNYNGVQYDVTVINAYNPWSDTWNYNVDMPAYNTSYYINGNTYNFYAPLSTGTYYFNL